MFFYIDPQSSLPIYMQLIDQIKELVAKGVLQPGEKLPSVRYLSKQMVVNPNTVSKAYQELERQNVIFSEPGVGSFISASTENEIDSDQLQRMKDELRKIMVDGFYYGIDKKTVKQWIDDIDDELRRPSS